MSLNKEIKQKLKNPKENVDELNIRQEVDRRLENRSEEIRREKR